MADAPAPVVRSSSRRRRKSSNRIKKVESAASLANPTEGKAARSKSKRKGKKTRKRKKSGYQPRISAKAVRQMADRTHVDLFEIQELVEKWHEHSRNGSIDKYGFRDMFGIGGVISPKVVDFLFMFFDVSGDGLLQQEEFLLGMSVLMKGTFVDKLRVSFNTYDINGDGFISRRELRKMLNYQLVSGGKLLVAMVHLDEIMSGADRDPKKEELTDLRDKISDDEIPVHEQDLDGMVAEAFRRYDKNEDDRICFDEFLEWANSEPSMAEVTLTINGWAPGTFGLGRESKPPTNPDFDIDFLSDDDDDDNNDDEGDA